MIRPVRTAVLLVVALASLAPAGAAGAAEGSLLLEVAPAKVGGGAGSVVVRVANPGGASVTGLVLTVDAPPEIKATLEPAGATVAAGGSMLTKLTVAGPPGVVVIKAAGMSGAVPVAAAVAVELSAVAPSTLVLVGSTTITDHSSATLQVIVTNTSDAAVHVELSADAGRHRALLDGKSLDLAARAVEDVTLTVTARGALRRGTVGVVVRADVTNGQPQHLVATRELAVSHASDELPGPLGVGSMILVPGLVALLAFFEVRSRDRRRIGAAHPGARAVWDNKTWLLLAGGLSLAAAAVYARVAGRDVLDAYELSDIGLLAVVLGAAGAGAALVTTVVHRRSVPVITSRSTPVDVLKAAQRNENSLNRKRYKTAEDRHGLLVHRDGPSFVLTPPIAFEAGGDLWNAWNDTADPDRFRKVVDRLTPGFDGHFLPGPDDIPGPMVVDDAVEVGQGELLVYTG